ncbi:hypothetical protein [Campylobacter jejuni]|uniref:hypothetical protein n=1 Tax=Campylobacter jejuni TaxID=197 RepID=UPI000774B12A|nr:hypothetical protein [Campylobacter jejuni]EAH4639599.1 DNA adenine methylase [Campylobacter jejuni]EAH5333219.1 DNA adenine methylase [Campylobacter jejuni]EAH7148325.1 DNA adenine methylase [Campylobacter jejuni]EAH9306834.1 DNA adenine methylase [Campylobacter jejuni]EAI4846532.1 DNA adenine methylase [Campylobacter jejuni]
METRINFNLKSTTREEIRADLINEFLKELPGNGVRDLSSKYYYVVENADGYNIILKRPAPLNKGFDFIVSVENFYFKEMTKKSRSNPSHNDIISLLKKYKKANEAIYGEVKNIIISIYNCENIYLRQDIQQFPKFVNFDNQEYPISILLYCIKWLFIEQDVTYWNYSGRRKFFEALNECELV